MLDSKYFQKLLDVDSARARRDNPRRKRDTTRRRIATLPQFAIAAKFRKMLMSQDHLASIAV